MRILFSILCCLVLINGKINAQEPAAGDTGKVLEEVVVDAFYSRAGWKDVAAAVATIGKKDLQRYPPVSLVPVLNGLPGVRMEERSPVSYRLSIRGSLLRSPFGVRSVKVYLNDIPLTDGGGNTYLNLIDINQLTGAGVLKGPVASVYGAGTGGALLLRSDVNFTPGAANSYDLGVSGGSYGLFQENAGWQYSDSSFTSSLQQSHQQSDGYRQQSTTRKDIVKWQGALRTGKQTFHFLTFYTDLFYQTPGGITLEQMQHNPKLARQTAGPIPGSVQQKAAIYNKTLFGAVHHEIELGSTTALKSFVTGNTTDFQNPFITNFEKRSEQNLGAGIQLRYHTGDDNSHSFQWVNGVEGLYNHSKIDNYGNRAGVADTVQYRDNIYATQWFAFSQAEYRLDRWSFTAGASINGQSYRYQRLSDPASVSVTKNISAVVTPRFAVLYKLSDVVSVYALAAKGFSAPSVAEVRPSDGNYYGDLQAEGGWNYELGVKGLLLNQRLQFDIAGYYFALKNAIVRRNNAAGAEYFVNAGGTVQKGIEAMVRYRLLVQPRAFVSGIHFWSSYSYQPYYFDSYTQGAIDYSGKRITGVPQHIWVSGLDIETSKRLSANISLNAVSSLPLTDANDAMAPAYRLVQCKLDYRILHRRQDITVFAGIDNVFNEVYSLGNDINALGKRYYNPAPGRNYFGGIRFRFN